MWEQSLLEVTGTYLPVSLRKITSINYPTWSWALRDTQSFSPFPPLSSGNGSQVKGETTRFISSLSVWPSSYPFIPFIPLHTLLETLAMEKDGPEMEWGQDWKIPMSQKPS
jgi:hypothetical protein